MPQPFIIAASAYTATVLNFLWNRQHSFDFAELDRLSQSASPVTLVQLGRFIDSIAMLAAHYEATRPADAEMAFSLSDMMGVFSELTGIIASMQTIAAEAMALRHQ